MGLWDKLGQEFIDIIEWLDPSRDTMVWRYPRYDNEIKNGAKLVVRESQIAVFVNEGEIADVFDPGTHELRTANLPILGKLKGWKYGFESPFKAEVYFVNTRRFVDQKWGTKNPIMLRDQEFGPVRLRAFGTYAFKVNDPSAFLKEVVGTDGEFTTDEITDQLRNIIVSRFADATGESKIPVLDMAANYNELGDVLLDAIKDDMTQYGLELTKMLVENNCKLVGEGANMPCTHPAALVFKQNGILFAPGKAGNAGGVAVSGLEQSQNAQRYSWSAAEVDKRLRDIMAKIHGQCIVYGKDEDGELDYVIGANLAGFVKVAEAMLAYGVV